MKTPQNTLLKTTTKTISTNKPTSRLNIEIASIKSSSTTIKEKQQRTKREASMNASLKTSMILQDEMQEPKKPK